MRKTLIFGALVLAALALADAVYFGPRYGGLAGWAFDGMMAGSETEALMGELGSLRSALSIYYGDTNGKYPQSLDELWKGGRYLPHPPRRADVYIEKGNNRFGRAHWYRDAETIKNFASLADADDTGGWGYVNDPKSPDYGTVFVNCMHINFKKGLPWNLIGPNTGAVTAGPAVSAPLAPGATLPPAPSASAALAEGFRGRVQEGGISGPGIEDAELVFSSEDGARTVSARSGMGGGYQVALPPGRYRVRAAHATHREYAPERGFYVVRPGVVGVGNIFLQPL